LLTTLLLAALLQQGSPAEYHGRTSWKRADLEGFANRGSIRPGETLDFYVSSRSAYDLELLRCGEFETVIQKAEDLPAKLQPVSGDASQEGCHWEPSLRLTIPTSWRTGLYKARLRSRNSSIYEIPFVVRADVDGTHSKVLTLAPDITVQAYNSYGGHNAQLTPLGKRSPLLSFDRPSDAQSPGTIDRQWDLNFLAWLEQELGPLEFASDVDLHNEPGLLDSYNLLVLFGHHAYWTREMRDEVDAFVGNGGNLCLVASQVANWQVRLEDNGRRLLCHEKPWKDPLFKDPDPQVRRGVTPLFSTPPVFDPPETTFGLGFSHAGCAGSGPGETCPKLPIAGQAARFPYFEGFGYYRRAQPSHPFFFRPGFDRSEADEALFGVRSFGTRADERTISLFGEIDGANLEGLPGGRVASRASGAPSNLQVLADGPAQFGFATVSSFRNRGTVLHTGSRGFLVSCTDPNGFVPEVQSFLQTGLRSLMRARGNLIRNGGFERWEGDRPLHFGSTERLDRTTRASGGKLALELKTRRVAISQMVSIPQGTRTLHLTFFARGTRSTAEVVLQTQDQELLSVPIGHGTNGFQYGRCKLAPGTSEIEVVIRKFTAGVLILDDFELLSDRRFRAKAWDSDSEAVTTTPFTIAAGRHAGGERLLVSCEARAPSGAGELRLLSRVGKAKDVLLGGASFSGDWQRVTFEAIDPHRGRRPAFHLELLPFKGSRVEVRSLHVFPLEVPGPAPRSLLLARTDEVSSEAPTDASFKRTRPLGELHAQPYMLTGWAQGEASIRIGTADSVFATREFRSTTPVALQEEFSPTDLKATASVTFEIPAGKQASLLNVRIRPKHEVIENDLVSNGGFEIRPTPQEVALRLDWSDRPPGWTTLERTQLRLDTSDPFRGECSLRIRSDSKNGGAQYLLAGHLPISQPLRLHAHIRTTRDVHATLHLMCTTLHSTRADRELASLAIPASEHWNALSLFATPDLTANPDLRVRGWIRIEVHEGTLWIDDLLVEADNPTLFSGF